MRILIDEAEDMVVILRALKNEASEFDHQYTSRGIEVLSGLIIQFQCTVDENSHTWELDGKSLADVESELFKKRSA